MRLELNNIVDHPHALEEPSHQINWEALVNV